MPYDAGTAFIQVVPSYEGVVTSISEKFTKDGDIAGQVFSDAFNEAARSGTKDASLGPSDADSAKKGDSSGGKFADGFKARVDAALKALPDVKINADSTAADFKLAEIRANLDDLRNKTIGVDLSDTEALAKLDELRARLVALSIESPSVRVKVDAASAITELDAVRLAANGASGSSGGGGLSGLSSSASALPAGLSASTLGMGALVLAAIPLAGVATAGAIGLVGMAAAVGAAAGAFGLAALPVFTQVSSAIQQIDADQKAIARSTSLAQYATNIQKLNLDLGHLNPTVAALVQGVLDVKQSFFNWDAQFNPAIVSVFNAALADVKPLLDDITPLVYAGAAGFKDIAQQIGLVAGQPDFKSFIQFLAAQAGPAFNTIASLVEQFGQAFADILQKSGPLIGQVEGGLTGIAGAALKWVDGGGFQKFLDWVQKNGPGIVKDVQDIAGTVGKLIPILAPIGERILTLVDAFSRFLNLPIVQSILGILSHLDGFSVGLAVIKGVVSGVESVLGDLSNFFTQTMPHAISVVSGAFTSGFQAIHNIVNTTWHAIDNDFIHPLTNFFIAVITPILAAFRATWNQVWNAVSDVVKVNWAIIQGILAVIEYVFAISLGATVLIFKSIWDAVWGAIGSTVIAVWNAIFNNVISPIVNFFSQTIPAAANTLWQAIDVAWQGVLGVTQAVWNAISSVISAVWGFVTGIVSAGVNFVSSIISSGMSTVSSIWSAVWSGIQAVISFAWGIISSIAGSIAGAFGGIESGVGTLGNVWSIVWGGIVGAASSAWSAISGVVGDIEGAVSSAIGFINDLIKAYNSIPFLGNVSLIPTGGSGPSAAQVAQDHSGSAHAAGTGSGTYKGWSWVGEKGPELVNFGTPVQILSHEQSVGAITPIGSVGNLSSTPAAARTGAAVDMHDFIIQNPVDLDAVSRKMAFAARPI